MIGVAALFFGALPPPAIASDESAFGTHTTSHVGGPRHPDLDRVEGDGVYGRFDGDLDLGMGVGVSTFFATGDTGPSLRAAAHWYSTAGPYLGYTESLGARAVERRLGLGLELEPLFLLRFSEAAEHGPALLDLTLDSLSLGLGVLLLDPPGEHFASHAGLELSLGFGVPLLARASGPWLEARAGWYAPESGREASGLVFLSWHFAVTTPLVRD